MPKSIPYDERGQDLGDAASREKKTHRKPGLWNKLFNKQTISCAEYVRRLSVYEERSAEICVEMAPKIWDTNRDIIHVQN